MSQKIYKWISRNTNNIRILLILSFFMLAVWAITLQHFNLVIAPWEPALWLTTLLINVTPELAGIVISVVTLDYLNERRQDQLYKGQLIRMMGSRHNDVSDTAVKELIYNKWLYDGSLHNASLDEANLAMSDLSNATLVGVDMKFAILTSTSFAGAQLINSDLEHANMTGALLIATNLSGANMAYTNLTGALLNKSILTNVDLSNANLSSADLTGVDLVGVKLDQAIYDGYTIWPEGFNPESTGARIPTDIYIYI